MHDLIRITYKYAYYVHIINFTCMSQNIREAMTKTYLGQSGACNEIKFHPIHQIVIKIHSKTQHTKLPPCAISPPKYKRNYILSISSGTPEYINVCYKFASVYFPFPKFS